MACSHSFAHRADPTCSGSSTWSRARKHRTSRALLACVAAVGLGGLLPGCGTTDRDVQYIAGADLRRQMDGAARRNDSTLVLLVDPRPAEQFAAAHIPGARNVLLSDVREDRTDARLRGFDNFVVYGSDASSGVAVAMAKRLMRVGYDNVYVLRGGLVGWRSAGGRVAEQRVETSDQTSAQPGPAPEATPATAQP